VINRSDLAGLARVTGRSVREFVNARLGPIETKIAGLADASRIVETERALVERCQRLESRLDKLEQRLSAVQKHNQALERKIGGLKSSEAN
jgi:phage shock protein A